MPWVEGERHARLVVNDRQVARPDDARIAAIVDGLELTWPPTMDQLAEAKRRLRELAADGEDIDVTWGGRFCEVVAVFRNRLNSWQWSIVISERKRP